MSARIAVHLTWCVVLCGPAVGRAQEPDFWAFLPRGETVTRCAEGSAASKQTMERLRDLDDRIERLDDGARVAGVVRDLHDLLKTECLRAAAETSRIPVPDTALSLKAWWTNGHGRDWLASFVELPRLGNVDSPVPHIVTPPDARKTLNLEAHGDHPVAILLCRLTDAACGRETRGWRLRAETYFASNRQARVPVDLASDEDPVSWSLASPLSPDEVSRQCDAKTSTRAATQRYQAWRACVEAARPKEFALPHGQFKAPKTGWLVIAGRRGHYDFCDTVRAYDLATGAAFIDDSCSGLALKPNGEVDRAATNAARQRRTVAGVVPVENLREAAWMLLFRGETAQLQVAAEFYPLPAGLTPQVTVRDDDGTSALFMWSHTGQTTLTWMWSPAVGPTIAGKLIWPNSSDVAESHAASLLSVAEEAFVEGCPPRRARSIPSLQPTPKPGARVSRVQRLNDVDDDDVRDLDRDVRQSRTRWATRGACPPD